MNKLRGEVEIELAGAQWTLRPTFEALSNIESKLNKSIPEIIREQRQGSIKFTTAAVIVWEGLCGANGGRPPMSKARSGKSLRYEDVGEMIVSEGLTTVISQDGMILFLLHGLAGDQKMQKAQEGEEVQPGEENPPTRTD